MGKKTLSLLMLGHTFMLQINRAKSNRTDISGKCLFLFFLFIVVVVLLLLFVCFL